ncbi:MAG: nucleotide disphospho-sugar-binding domain-containing protein, partial [Pseudomonadota bacterium]
RHKRANRLPDDLFVFLNGCVREEARFDPPKLPINNGPIIYLSFGSLGAIDTQLIKRMIATFSGFPARFFINVGTFLGSYSDVPDNVYLGEWFPQPSIVSQSDVFIHRGGNNSFCEALYFGVPSLVMPYCWDGHDNGLRAHQTGVGSVLSRRDWTESQLTQALRDLLASAHMQTRLAANAQQMQHARGAEHAARVILERTGAKDRLSKCTQERDLA